MRAAGAPCFRGPRALSQTPLPALAPRLAARPAHAPSCTRAQSFASVRLRGCGCLSVCAHVCFCSLRRRWPSPPSTLCRWPPATVADTQAQVPPLGLVAARPHPPPHPPSSASQAENPPRRALCGSGDAHPRVVHVCCSPRRGHRGPGQAASSILAGLHQHHSSKRCHNAGQQQVRLAPRRAFFFFTVERRGGGSLSLVSTPVLPPPPPARVSDRRARVRPAAAWRAHCWRVTSPDCWRGLGTQGTATVPSLASFPFLFGAATDAALGRPVSQLPCAARVRFGAGRPRAWPAGATRRLPFDRGRRLGVPPRVRERVCGRARATSCPPNTHTHTHTHTHAAAAAATTIRARRCGR